MYFLHIIWLFLCVIVLSSCSTLRKISVNSFAPVYYKASVSFEDEDNWENFKQSVLGNLKLGEGLLSITPENKSLLATLTKGYGGYAFIVNETQHLEDFLQDNGEGFNRDQAIRNYIRAYNYGLRYLNQVGITYQDFMKNIGDSSKNIQLLDENMSISDQDLEVVLFIAHALSGLINLQKDRPGMVAQLPIAKTMFDWVCSKKPDINFGTCDVFYGIYESGRPVGLGGNPSRGEKQYYLVPMGDEEGYRKQKQFLDDIQEKFNRRIVVNWSYDDFVKGERSKKQSFKKGNRLKIYQATSLKRYNIIEKYHKEIF